MSVFGDIMSAIFGSKAKAGEPGVSQTAPVGTGPTPSARTFPSTTSSGGTPTSQVDVAAILDAAAKAKKQKLNWRKSIVDLMKLLDLDSGSAARKQLAKELNYNGDTKDSAKMNIWLHKQVMIKLAENGGKVPDDLKH